MLININTKIYDFNIEDFYNIEDFDPKNHVITMFNGLNNSKKKFKFSKKKIYTQEDVLIIHIEQDIIVESYSGNKKVVKSGFYNQMIANIYTDTDYGFDFDTTGRDYVEIILNINQIICSITEIT